MNTTHTLEVHATCPVDGTPDRYDVVIETGAKIVPVERILDMVEVATSGPVYQEALTAALAGSLGVKVTTTGQHSGVTTVCTAG